MTLIELVVTMAGMFFVTSAALMFVIFQVEQNATSFDRVNIQQGGRSALNIMARELGMAGVGLPRRLAIKAFDNDGDLDEDSNCDSKPFLEIAYLDLLRQWTVTSTAGTLGSGDINLASADPVPAIADDTAIGIGEWVFLHANQGVDFDIDGDGSQDHGHGMLKVGQNRPVTGTVINIGSANYNLNQSSFNLADRLTDDPISLLRVTISKFGVNCSDPDHPVLYWKKGTGNMIPVARNVDLEPLASDALDIGADAGDQVGLRFRFLVDHDPRDGQPDDLSLDGTVDHNDLTAAPTDLSEVVAVEVLLRVRSENADSDTGEFEVKNFVQLVRTPNIRTSLPKGTYYFVHNSGI